MNFLEAVKISLKSLWSSKLRSILTLLGVVIGVASVIAVITLVNGANKFVATKISGYGSDTFTIKKTPSVITSGEEWLKFQKRKDVKNDDYEAIRDNCKLCQITGASIAGHDSRGLWHAIQHRHGPSRLDVDDADHLPT